MDLLRDKEVQDTRGVSWPPPEKGRNLINPYLPGTKEFTERVDAIELPNPLTTPPSQNLLMQGFMAMPIKGVGKKPWSGKWNIESKPETNLIEDYRGQHSAPLKDSGSPIYDLKDTYPDDIYSYKAAQYYGHYGQNDPKDMLSIGTMQFYRNRPNNPITIYRAVPKDAPAKGINPGDWVTINRNYAKEHGESALNGNYKIIKKTVYARDIYTNGDSIHEWGYDPQPRVPKPENK